MQWQCGLLYWTALVGKYPLEEKKMAHTFNVKLQLSQLLTGTQTCQFGRVHKFDIKNRNRLREKSCV